MNRLDLLDLADFENIYVGYCLGAFDYAELKRRHAKRNPHVGKLEVVADVHRGASGVGADDSAPDYLGDAGD